jgi:hypothetical protein
MTVLALGLAVDEVGLSAQLRRGTAAVSAGQQNSVVPPPRMSFHAEEHSNATRPTAATARVPLVVHCESRTGARWRYRFCLDATARPHAVRPVAPLSLIGHCGSRGTVRLRCCFCLDATAWRRIMGRLAALPLPCKAEPGGATRRSVVRRRISRGESRVVVRFGT